MKVEHLLRGAAKGLGCNSASLLLIDEARRLVTVRVGTYQPNLPMVEEVERIFGDINRNFTIPLSAVEDSLVIQSYRRKELLESSTVAELVGTAFPEDFVRKLQGVVGQHSFICVPTLGQDKILGVTLFEKEDPHPFSLQQRELMLRYARRVAQAIEMEISPEARAQSNMSFTFDGNHVHLMLAEASPALILDNDLHITLASKRIEVLLGYHPPNLVGRSIQSLLANPEVMGFLHDSASGESMVEETIKLIHRDGYKVEVSAQILYMVDEMGQVQGYVMVLRLPDRFTRRQNDFAALLRRERLVALGEIAAQLAHEIRNPLISVGTMIDLLRRERRGDPGLDEPLETVARELARMDAIITDYLSLAARYRIVIQETNMESLIAEAVKVARLHRSSKDKAVDHQVQAGLTCRLDYNGIKQVLLNLLINALEASPPQGAIRCSATASGTKMLIVVEDVGSGLPQDGCDLFEPFFTTKEQGTGLGLTVCRRIVEAHGGTIDLTNRPEGGCQATVMLPLTS